MNHMEYLDRRVGALEKDLEDYDALHPHDEDAPYDYTRRMIEEELDTTRDELEAIEAALEERAFNAGRI